MISQTNMGLRRMEILWDCITYFVRWNDLPDEYGTETLSVRFMKQPILCWNDLPDEYGTETIEWLDYIISAIIVGMISQTNMGLRLPIAH